MTDTTFTSKDEVPALLRLPAELRNKIYDFIFKHDEPLFVVGSTAQSSQGPKIKPKVLYGSGLDTLDLQFFEVCQQICLEATTRFYRSNEFIVRRTRRGVQIRFHDPVGRLSVGLASDWLESLGTSTKSIKKVVINLDALCPLRCTGQSNILESRYTFREEDGLIEVHPLLHALWKVDHDLEVEFIQPQGQDLQAFRSWSARNCGAFGIGQFSLDVGAITNVINALIRGQLHLRKYGRQLKGVGIKRDGSGGSVSWATSIDGQHYRYQPPPFPDPRSYRGTPTAFSASEAGKTLKFQATTASLLTLPENLRYNIYRQVMIPRQPIEIDLDSQKSFSNGLLCVNKEVYTKWRQFYLSANSFNLRMSRSEIVTTFSDFHYLANILRATLHPSLSGLPRTVNLDHNELLEDRGEWWQKVFVELNFDLAEPVAPWKLRTSILPLLLETSSTPGRCGEYITIAYPERDGDDVVQAKQRIQLRKLRYEVTQALRELLGRQPNSTDLVQPGIWIDGFGEVADVVTMPGVTRPKAQIKFPKAHSTQTTVKEVRYKSQFCQKCHPHIFQSEFPFTNSARATYDYLRWVMHKLDSRDDLWYDMTKEMHCTCRNRY